MSTTAANASSSSMSLPDLLGKFSLLRRRCSSDSHDFRVQKLYVVDSSPVKSPVLRERIMAALSNGVGPEGMPRSTNYLPKEIKATSEASCEATTGDTLTKGRDK